MNGRRRINEAALLVLAILARRGRHEVDAHAKSRDDLLELRGAYGEGHVSGNEAHLLMAHYLTELNVGWKAEYRFADGRKYRFDFCIPEHRIGIEIEGGIYVQGRHTRGKGYQHDLWKYNQAALLGYRVFRFSTQDVKNGKAKEVLARAVLITRLGELKEAITVRRADRSET